MTRPLKQTFIGLSFLIFSGSALLAGEISYEDVWPVPGAGPRGPGDGILVNHQPHNFGGYMADTDGFESVGGQPIWQLVADDFSLPIDSTIRRIVFWGFYNYGIEPATDETFEIQFHHPRDSDGLPGAVFYEATFLNPIREWTGRNVISAGGGREYRFTINFPSALPLGGGDLYWLSIHQLGDPATAFRWEASVNPAPPNGDAFTNPIVGDWTFSAFPIGADNAFQLISVPEPASGLIAILATSLLFKRRR